MKILGEKSLSSKVEKGLKILFFIITLLDIITLTFTSITLFSEFNSSSMRNNYLSKIVLEGTISCIFIATGIVALFIIYQFIKIFRNLKQNKLFEKKNTDYLKKVSKLSIIIGFLYLTCLIGISIFLRNYNSLDLLTDFLPNQPPVDSSFKILLSFLKYFCNSKVTSSGFNIIFQPL